MKKPVSWDLFRKAVYNNLSDIEHTEFQRWLNSDPANRKYYENARKIHLEKELRISDDKTTACEGWDEFRGRVKAKKRKVYFSTLQKFAAFALIGVFIFFAGRQLKFYKQLTEAYNNSVIEPGSSVAILTLENGPEILLEDMDTIVSLNKSQSFLSVASGSIDYSTISNSEEIEPTLNRISIPRGGEYRVTLPDGSLMWVNSESVIEYYVPFVDNKREVIIRSGEICLDVLKDSLHPFQVKTDDYTAQVLGTILNVSAYPNDDFTTTTLVEGSVEIIGPGVNSPRRILLEPDQQLVYNKTTSETSVREVDASAYTSWTRGFFLFEDETLFSIFNKLERWYDIKVFFFSEEAENEFFTGKLPRFDNLEHILKIINEVSLSELELKGNTVTIK